jgi:hypothetical protein
MVNYFISIKNKLSSKEARNLWKKGNRNNI